MFKVKYRVVIHLWTEVTQGHELPREYERVTNFLATFFTLAPKNTPYEKL